MHSVCRCSLPVWRRSFLKKGTPRDLFWPRLGSTPGGIWPKNNNTCKGPWVLHPYQVSSKSIQWFWRKSRKCEKFTDGRRTVRYDNSSLGSGELKTTCRCAISFSIQSLINICSLKFSICINCFLLLLETFTSKKEMIKFFFCVWIVKLIYALLSVDTRNIYTPSRECIGMFTFDCYWWLTHLHGIVASISFEDGVTVSYSQSKSSVHDKLHELHSHFPPIAQRTPSIITSCCWRSSDSDITASGIDRKKGCVQNVTCLVALTIRNLYDITKRKNMLMCLHLKVCHYDFNMKIYCICFISYKSPLF